MSGGYPPTAPTTAVPPFTALARVQDKISAPKRPRRPGRSATGASQRAIARAVVSFPAAQLLVIAILGGAAGVIAAIRPARRAARLPVLRAIAAQ